MTTTFKRITKETRKVALIKNHIKAHHNTLPSEFINNLTPLELLTYTHPLHRADYATQYLEQGLVTKLELQERNISFNTRK